MSVTVRAPTRTTAKKRRRWFPRVSMILATVITAAAMAPVAATPASPSARSGTTATTIAGTTGAIATGTAVRHRVATGMDAPGAITVRRVAGKATTARPVAGVETTVPVTTMVIVGRAVAAGRAATVPRETMARLGTARREATAVPAAGKAVETAAMAITDLHRRVSEVHPRSVRQAQAATAAVSAATPTDRLRRSQSGWEPTLSAIKPRLTPHPTPTHTIDPHEPHNPLA